MLSMTACQIGDPITTFILMISDDRLLHVVMILVLQEGRLDRKTTIRPDVIVPSILSGLESMSPFLERQFRSLSGGNIRPVPAFILIEAADKNDVSIEMAKF